MAAGIYFILNHALQLVVYKILDLELQFRPDLLEPAAHLLNEQWPRSLEARKHSIADSKTDLPVSLLPITKDKERVIGFVRIFKVANRSNAGLIESLAISPDTT
uniref:N-acetyltransferase domain-containing protein n=1 Tax=Amphimedon queenslandica TaxID=400682 RepID=A0A1X7URC5_AMPQE